MTMVTIARSKRLTSLAKFLCLILGTIVRKTDLPESNIDLVVVCCADTEVERCPSHRPFP